MKAEWPQRRLNAEEWEEVMDIHRLVTQVRNRVTIKKRLRPITPVVLPNYASIQCVRDIAEPWIHLWGGSEWGESMEALRAACHTSYGFSDEDCALFAAKLLENLEVMKEWALSEGGTFGFWEPDAVAATQAEARQAREYWRKGGNLTRWEPAISAANKTIATLPVWLFEGDYEVS